METVGREVAEYKLKVLELQRTRWKSNLGKIHKEENLVYYSGENTQVRNGPPFIINNQFRGAVTIFKLVNGRISYTCKAYKEGSRNLKNKCLWSNWGWDWKNYCFFYEQLEAIWEEMPKHGILF